MRGVRSGDPAHHSCTHTGALANGSLGFAAESTEGGLTRVVYDGTVAAKTWAPRLNAYVGRDLRDAITVRSDPDRALPPTLRR